MMAWRGLGSVSVVVVVGSACTPWRVPPTATVVDHAPSRAHAEPLDAGIDAPQVHRGESLPEVEIAARTPGRPTVWPSESGELQPRLVKRGGQDVWIGEPDRVRQDWIDNLGYPTFCPLAVSFDGAPVQLQPTRAADFDLGAPFACAEVDWPSADTPWLVLDRDANGTIDDGRELFGAATRLPDGTLARNGFEALAPLDGDGDGRITSADPAWSSLRLWADLDGDRVSDPGELSRLDDAGIVALDLDDEARPRCDARGNCEVERSSMQWKPAGVGGLRQGALVDVHLRCR